MIPCDFCGAEAERRCHRCGRSFCPNHGGTANHRDGTLLERLFSRKVLGPRLVEKPFCDECMGSIWRIIPWEIAIPATVIAAIILTIILADIFGAG